MSDDLLSAAEWLALPPYDKLKVVDPDGWDRSNFDASWSEKISEGEFNRRLMSSSVTPKR